MIKKNLLILPSDNYQNAILIQMYKNVHKKKVWNKKNKIINVLIVRDFIKEFNKIIKIHLLHKFIK